LIKSLDVSNFNEVRKTVIRMKDTITFLILRVTGNVAQADLAKYAFFFVLFLFSFPNGRLLVLQTADDIKRHFGTIDI
jgi:hypothetical protein